MNLMGAVVVCPHGLSAAAVRLGSVRLRLGLFLGVPLRVASLRYALGLRSAPIHPLRVWIPLYEACGLRSKRHYVPLRSLRPSAANPSRAVPCSIVPTASMLGGFLFLSVRERAGLRPHYLLTRHISEFYTAREQPLAAVSAFPFSVRPRAGRASPSLPAH